jgi:hypothetical protein
VDWLAKKTGKPYRLLSEAEWEYAARGRTSPGAYPRFWFGNDEKDLCRYGNFADQKYGVSDAPCNDGYDHTSPAGHYAPNAFGLYDMLGNAWQWTADCHHDSYNGAPADGSAWTTGCSDSYRVVRGGSWHFNPRSLRAAQPAETPARTPTSVSALPGRLPLKCCPAALMVGRKRIKIQSDGCAPGSWGAGAVAAPAIVEGDGSAASAASRPCNAVR